MLLFWHDCTKYMKVLSKHIIHVDSLAASLHILPVVDLINFEDNLFVAKLKEMFDVINNSNQGMTI